jgi:Papain family cysteine protease
MAIPKTVTDLRTALQASNAKWTIDPKFKTMTALPQYALGADLTKVPKVTSLPRTDITPYLSALTSNPFLLQRRIERGYVKASSVTGLFSAATDPGFVSAVRAGESPITIISEPLGKTATPVKPIQIPTIAPTARTAAAPTGAAASPALAPVPGAGAAPAVDWRNRWGWPWLTDIKDQGGCESCWVFSAVGVVEAMTRIEHCEWSLRSEGDVHDGLGASCAQRGGPPTAFDWMKTNGVADPGCWPYEQSNLKYNPTPDRDGRTVKLDDYVALTTVQDQKDWLDNVGPISACFEVYQDFWYGSDVSTGVYTQQSNVDIGGHCIVIVGYDDTQQAWLMRNSWGTGWGNVGYCWFGYGQCNIDAYAKYGVPNTNTNPDPWTKRRIHNGNLYESGDGAGHRNFESWSVGPNNVVRHYWRDGVSLQWALAETFANDCKTCPSAQGTTFNRNFEMVFQTTTNRLHHWYFDQSTGKYNDGGVFGPTNVASVPGFIQGDYGAPGNFELVVMTADGKLCHWYRPNTPVGVWAQSVTFGSNVAHSGPTVVQRRDHGLDVVCVNTDGTMQRYWRDDAHGMVWNAGEKFASNINSSPVMIEGDFNAIDETVQGNYEMCVAVNGAIQHWWRDNRGTQNWFNSATFGTTVAGASVVQVVGLLESSYGFDLEVLALLSNGSIQHFWRQWDGWHEGPVIGSTTV